MNKKITDFTSNTKRAQDTIKKLIPEDLTTKTGSLLGPTLVGIVEGTKAVIKKQLELAGIKFSETELENFIKRNTQSGRMLQEGDKYFFGPFKHINAGKGVKEGKKWENCAEYLSGEYDADPKQPLYQQTAKGVLEKMLQTISLMKGGKIQDFHFFSIRHGETDKTKTDENGTPLPAYLRPLTEKGQQKADRMTNEIQAKISTLAYSDVGISGNHEAIVESLMQTIFVNNNKSIPPARKTTAENEKEIIVPFNNTEYAQFDFSYDKQTGFMMTVTMKGYTEIFTEQEIQTAYTEIATIN